MNVNLVIVAGRLTRDPQLKYTTNQTAVCEFGIAVNEKFKDKERVNFFDVTAWGKTAEAINTYFQKGREIHIIGRLRYESWEDKQGGGKRSKIAITAESFQFVGSKAQSSQDEQPKTQQAAPDEPQSPIGNEKEFAEDDIPFT